jgi:hypothetical protein
MLTAHGPAREQTNTQWPYPTRQILTPPLPRPADLATVEHGSTIRWHIAGESLFAHKNQLQG